MGLEALWQFLDTMVEKMQGMRAFNFFLDFGCHPASIRYLCCKTHLYFGAWPFANASRLADVVAGDSWPKFCLPSLYLGYLIEMSPLYINNIYMIQNKACMGLPCPSKLLASAGTALQCLNLNFYRAFTWQKS